MNVKSKEEAEELCNTNPAAESGRLRVENNPWYNAKGITIQQNK
jgi:hypothetical protein